jgi:peptide/nickel transport system substrate-binding protein
MNVNFYQNEDELLTAFESGDITSSSQLPTAKVSELIDSDQYRVIQEPLPRVFAVFFNQNRAPALRDTAVRLALTTAIDRDVLIDTTLSGFGIPITSPIPPNHPAVESTSQISGNSTSSPKEKAETILTRAGWIKNNTGSWEKRIDGEVRTLNITLKAANTPAFEGTIDFVARAWRDLGITVQVEAFEQSDLLQAVIRPRDFEALLFGIDMNRAVDLYPFWHSSQREDPGLNISQYANIEVDKLLDRARIATTTDEQNNLNRSALQIIARETPATFLYVPQLSYVLQKESSVPEMKRISKPQDRFMNIQEWSTATDTIWPIFK